jgi:hypothetical protein
MDPHPFVVVPLFFLAFAGLWVGGQIWITGLTGWGVLARSYRCTAPFKGIIRRFSNCRLTRMSWEGFEAGVSAAFPSLPRDVTDEQRLTAITDLRIGANTTGMYLAQLFLGCRFAHLPLFIPWGDVAVSRRSANWLDEVVQQFGGRYWPGGRGQYGGASAETPKYLVFRFRQAPGIFLQLGLTDGLLLAEEAGRSWPGESLISATPSPPNEEYYDDPPPQHPDGRCDSLASGGRPL